MTKQYEASQNEILGAIQSTESFWKGLQKETLVRGNTTCSLCTLIKTVYNTSFQKGSARGACLLCPVKYFGLFHICVGIQHVYSTPDITTTEMNALRKTVVNSLHTLQQAISKKKNYDEYLSTTIALRRSSILGQQAGKIRRNTQEERVKPKRIFKHNK